MDHKITWKHKNGLDEVITDPSGNTYIGEISHKIIFEIYKKIREGEFMEIEFDNQLLIALNKNKDYKRIPNNELKKWEESLK